MLLDLKYVEAVERARQRVILMEQSLMRQELSDPSMPLLPKVDVGPHLPFDEWAM